MFLLLHEIRTDNVHIHLSIGEGTFEKSGKLVR